jgi:hypothetical protein
LAIVAQRFVHPEGTPGIGRAIVGGGHVDQSLG